MVMLISMQSHRTMWKHSVFGEEFANGQSAVGIAQWPLPLTGRLISCCMSAARSVQAMSQIHLRLVRRWAQSSEPEHLTFTPSAFPHVPLQSFESLKRYFLCNYLTFSHGPHFPLAFGIEMTNSCEKTEKAIDRSGLISAGSRSDCRPRAKMTPPKALPVDSALWRQMVLKREFNMIWIPCA